MNLDEQIRIILKNYDQFITTKEAIDDIKQLINEARHDALNNWTYKIIGRIQGKELLFADEVREEVQKRIKELQND